MFAARSHERLRRSIHMRRQDERQKAAAALVAAPAQHRALPSMNPEEELTMLKGGLLWLISIPIPIILLLWLIGVL